MNITNYIDFFEILNDSGTLHFDSTQIIEADWEIIEDKNGENQ